MKELYNLLKVELADEDRVQVSDEDRELFNKSGSFSYFFYEKKDEIIHNFKFQEKKQKYDAQKLFNHCKNLGYKCIEKKDSYTEDFEIYITDNFSLYLTFNTISFNDKNGCHYNFHHNYDDIINLAKLLATEHTKILKIWKTLCYENQDKLIKNKVSSLIEHPTLIKEDTERILQEFKAELEGKIDFKDSSLQYDLQPLVDYVYQENLKYRKLVNLTEKSIDVMLKNSQSDYNKDHEAIRIKMPGRRYVEFKFDKKDALKTKQFFDKLEELEALLKQMPRTTIKYYGSNMTWQKGENQ